MYLNKMVKLSLYQAAPIEDVMKIRFQFSHEEGTF